MANLESFEGCRLEMVGTVVSVKLPLRGGQAKQRRLSYWRRFESNLMTLARVTAVLLAGVATASAQTGGANPTGVSGQFNGNITTGGSFDPLTGNATRSCVDLAVPGSVGYPLAFTRTLNTRFPGAWRNNYSWAVTSGVHQPGRRRRAGGSRGIYRVFSGRQKDSLYSKSRGRP